MSSVSTPSRSEVLAWDARSLAEYLKRLKLSGCDKVVTKSNINGARFLKMTENDLQKFPKMHIPIISRICGEINRNEEKRGFGHRFKETTSHPQDFTQEEVWNSDEFDSDEGSNQDYEEPDETMEYSSECAMSEQPGTRMGGEEEWNDEVNNHTDQNPGVLCRARLLGNGNYIDFVHSGSSAASIAARGPRPPQRPEAPAANRYPARPPLPRANLSHQQPLNTAGKPPPSPAAPQMDRSKKPVQAGHPRADLLLSKGSPVGLPHPPMGKPYLPKGPKPQDRPSPGRPTRSQPSSHPRMPSAQARPSTDMDPRWYGGQMTRLEGEMSLRRINKDGAFLVRDSSRGLSGQPYTLMVLHLGKVYNLQVRLESSSYSLGTGLMGTQSFPMVREIIAYHAQTPLLLIDAMDPETQRHCCLLHPTGN